MSRMSAKDRAYFYPILIKRYGEHCNHCQKAPPDYRLVIDHIDNNNQNNQLENMQLLCYSCNGRKNCRGPGKKQSSVCVSVRATMSTRPPSPELQKNQECEPIFRNWCNEIIQENKTLSYEELVNGGAEISNCSVDTAKKYLNKMCSITGAFDCYQNEQNTTYVRLKSKSENTLSRTTPKQDTNNVLSFDHQRTSAQ